jgi:ABC-type sulfate/molybdate transport systems ATPase subunit
VQDPPLLLLDEPFTGLDRLAGDRLQTRLRRRRNEGRAVVLVTHDLGRASAVADTAVILLAGRVAHVATGDELSRDALEATYGRALDSGLSGLSGLSAEAAG